MKKIDKEKLKEIGKKIGIFIAVVFVFLSWFLMGVRYGRKHPKNDNVTASADTLPYNIDYGAHVPIEFGDYRFGTKAHGVNSFTFGVRAILPNSYLIVQSGYLKMNVGGYYDAYNDNVGLDLKTLGSTYDIQAGISNSTYTNVQFYIRFEVLDIQGFTQEMYDDPSGLMVSEVRCFTNWYTDDYSVVASTYKKDIINYMISFMYKGNIMPNVVIGVYPLSLQYKNAQSTLVTFDDLIFYVNSYSTRNIIYPLGNLNDYSSGYNNGYVVGYNNGQNASSVDSYNAGYSKGFADGNTDGNSLRDVVKTAVETPVNMFKTILNWNFLGYNLFTLFSTIITIVLAVFIVKKLM